MHTPYVLTRRVIIFLPVSLSITQPIRILLTNIGFVGRRLLFVLCGQAVQVAEDLLVHILVDVARKNVARAPAGREKNCANHGHERSDDHGHKRSDESQ